jgi:hypothetical protein
MYKKWQRSVGGLKREDVIGVPFVAQKGGGGEGKSIKGIDTKHSAPSYSVSVGKTTTNTDVGSQSAVKLRLMKGRCSMRQYKFVDTMRISIVFIEKKCPFYITYTSLWSCFFLISLLTLYQRYMLHGLHSVLSSKKTFDVLKFRLKISKVFEEN